MKRREFIWTTLTIAAGLRSLRVVPCELPEMPYQLGVWNETECHLFPVDKMLTDWGKVIAYGEYVFRGDTATWLGACLLRTADTSIISSRRFGSSYPLIDEDSIQLNFALEWEPYVSKDEWDAAVAKMPASRRIVKGFEPYIIADRGIYLEERDYKLMRLEAPCQSVAVAGVIRAPE